MRFEISHTIPATRDRVEQAILDPAFQERLAHLPDVGDRDVKSQTQDDQGKTHRLVVYRFGGKVPSAVSAAIGTSDVTWDEIGVFDPHTHVWSITIKPHVFASKFTCSGFYAFEALGDATIRKATFDLQVNVFLVGRLVENAIKEGLQRSLAAESEMLSEFLS